MRDSRQPRHLLLQHGWLAAVPAVGEQDDDSPTSHAAHSPGVVELAKVLAETSATRPVDNARGRSVYRGVGIPRGELARDAREPRAQREGLHAPATHHCGMEEARKRTRVWLHRSTDVEQEHNASRLQPGREKRARHGLPAGPK